jgi:hypothetical protein
LQFFHDGVKVPFLGLVRPISRMFHFTMQIGFLFFIFLFIYLFDIGYY